MFEVLCLNCENLIGHSTVSHPGAICYECAISNDPVEMEMKIELEYFICNQEIINDVRTQG